MITGILSLITQEVNNAQQESKIQRTISNIREDIDIKWEKIKVFY